MTTSSNNESEPQTSPKIDGGTMEAMLRSEIEFWREIIATSQSSECLERMGQALALAESRLAKVLFWEEKESCKRH